MFRAFPTLLRIGLAEAVAYRAELVIWVLTATAPLISMFIWDRVAEEGPLGGWGQGEMARYFLLTLIVRHITSSWVVWELNENIRTGGLSPMLLRPMHPLVFFVAQNLAAMPLRAVILAPLIAGVMWWRPELMWTPEPWTVALGLLSAALAWVIAFTVQVIFGSLAFFSQQSLGLFNVWFGLWSLGSGYLFPLELAPDWLRQGLLWLPFRATLATPVELLAGLVDGPSALRLVLAQLVWVGVFLGIAALTWSRGVRRHEAVGA
ncbi:ABC-2 family transporter protein [Myxococcota bacterium]|nr:ABC-2 family transporter protein [Myxococcota bacterium]